VTLVLKSKPVLTLEVARALAAAAETQIVARKFAMFVAVVDDSGTPLFVARFNDAQPASYEVAVQKAQVSARFRRSTRAFEDRVLKDGRLNLLTLPGIVAVEGGVPLTVDGTIVGAVGVSGGTGVEDGEVAAAAADALPGLLGIARNFF
jgi:glc operon protein GlcG